MSLITKMRRQNAIYWPPAASPDDFGHPAYGDLVELVLTEAGNYRVRWEDKNEEFLDGTSTVQRSNAVVYVPLLPDGTEVQVGGFLWLGDRAGLTSETVPQNNPGAWEVRQVGKLPNLKATEYLRTVYL